MEWGQIIAIYKEILNYKILLFHFYILYINNVAHLCLQCLIIDKISEKTVIPWGSSKSLLLLNCSLQELLAAVLVLETTRLLLTAYQPEQIFDNTHPKDCLLHLLSQVSLLAMLQQLLDLSITEWNHLFMTLIDKTIRNDCK